jgi:hypothetical protein
MQTLDASYYPFASDYVQFLNNTIHALHQEISKLQLFVNTEAEKSLKLIRDKDASIHEFKKQQLKDTHEINTLTKALQESLKQIDSVQESRLKQVKRFADMQDIINENNELHHLVYNLSQ